MITGPGRTVGIGLRFPEGPVALADGRIACVEMQAGRVVAVAPDGAISPIAHVGGGPNGLAVGIDGQLYVANNGGLSINEDGSYWHADDEHDGCVQRISGAGEAATVAQIGDLPGPRPHRPNDLCVAPDGSLVVTDSANWEDLPNLLPGRLVRIDGDGATSTLAELAAMPNGVTFTADGATLLVAQSLTRRIWAYPWDDGRLGEPREHCRLPSGSSPDGLCLDTTGRLYVAGSIGDAVHVVDPGGELVATLDTGGGSQPTNCCLDGGLLYVTLAKRGELVAFDVDADGVLFGAAAWVSS